MTGRRRVRGATTAASRKAGNLVTQLFDDPRALVHKIRVKLEVRALDLRNRLPYGSVVGDGDAVVSVTSYGFRTAYVHLALESIARGKMRPRRLILWLDDDAVLNDLPLTLKRMRRRGLEVLRCENYGPHKKQYPYATSQTHHALPLVTGDDDVLYPRNWLVDMVEAHRISPDDVIGHRAHRIELVAGRFAPYDTWTPRRGTAPSYRVFCTGAGGILYPAALLDHVRNEGDRFMTVCPRADDVWMHYVSVRHGYTQRQVSAEQRTFEAIPGTQAGTLFRANVREGGNDKQIADTYGEAERGVVAAAPA